MSKIKLSLGLAVFWLIAGLVAVGVSFLFPASAAEGKGEATRVSSAQQTKVLTPAFIENAIYEKEDLGTNLALEKTATANGYNDVYEAIYCNDGLDTSYWEGEADEYPQLLTVDLGADTDISTVRILLNPDSIWSKRTMTYSVEVSADGENYTALVTEAGFDFNPKTGNQYTHRFDTTSARYVRLVFTGNTGAYGGQVAEFEIFA